MKYISKIQKLLMGILLAVAVLVPQQASAATASKPAAGDGSKDNPFQITKVEEMLWFAGWVNGTYTPDDGATATAHPSACAKLMDNFYVGSDNFEPIGNANVKYSGTFDGNGKQFYSVYCVEGSDYVGLFGYTDGATIKNLDITGGVIVRNDAGAYIGSLVGRADNSVLQNIYIGYDYFLISCTKPKNSGGIVGRACNTDILDCEVVHGYYSENSYDYVGGICGYFDGGHIRRCSVSNFNTTKPLKGGNYMGGIVGCMAKGYISDCANFADVEGKNYVGGLIGFLDHGTLENVLTCASVTSNPTYSYQKDCGIIVGFDIAPSASGVIAYSENCTLTRNDVSLTVSSDYFSNAKCFTTEQLASGEAAYTLNGSTSKPADGSTLAWYQKLGEGGDAHPVLKPTGSNTVYLAHEFKCDGITQVGDRTTYQNSEKLVQPHKYEETQVPDYANLYYQKCSVCSALKDNKRTVKNFCGKQGNDLELTYENDTYSLAELTLTDGEAYNSPVEIEVADLKYKRTYTARKWQPLYVPFELSVRQLAEKGISVACINNFHEMQLKSGETQVSLEVLKVASGLLNPSTPYLILADADGESVMEFGATTLDKAFTTFFSCWSVTREYTFCGTCKEIGGFADERSFVSYAVRDGELSLLNAEDDVVKPQEWYLMVRQRDNLYGDDTPLSLSAKRISINVIGEGEATGIEDISVTSSRSDAGGDALYDLQGRRLQTEPTRGIYIKNGKKVVK